MKFIACLLADHYRRLSPRPPTKSDSIRPRSKPICGTSSCGSPVSRSRLTMRRNRRSARLSRRHGASHATTMRPAGPALFHVQGRQEDLSAAMSTTLTRALSRRTSTSSTSKARPPSDRRPRPSRSWCSAIFNVRCAARNPRLFTSRSTEAFPDSGARLFPRFPARIAA